MMGESRAVRLPDWPGLVLQSRDPSLFQRGNENANAKMQLDVTQNSISCTETVMWKIISTKATKHILQLVVIEVRSHGINNDDISITRIIFCFTFKQSQFCHIFGFLKVKIGHNLICKGQIFGF